MDINTERERRRRKGQTLVEFAITLPIVLLLMFGIIEFGRIFQAWVTLQNAARAAARYASTGQYDPRYQMTFNDQSDPDGFIPCVDEDQRGSLNPEYTAEGSPYKVKIYEGGPESLFATWNDGRDCDPESDDHQAMRKDMARILSIMEEARRGASGLALETNPLVIPDDKTVAEDQPWYEVWKNPYSRSDQRGWFNVMMCSSRQYLAGTSEENVSNGYQLVADDGTTVVNVGTRFITLVSGNALRNKATGEDVNPQPMLPACVLNEKMTDSYLMENHLVDNSGIPWMDPGGPGDNVTIIVTFNHPLITPLGLAPYIQMEARRTAIVEAFRASKPNSAINRAGVKPPDFEIEDKTDTPVPNTDTPVPNTDTPVPNTDTPVPPTRTPFDCARITFSQPRIQDNAFRVDITNDNDLDTVLTRAIFQWRTNPDYPNMFVDTMAISDKKHWDGQDTTPPTDTDVDASNPTFASVAERDRRIRANDWETWTALISNGPKPLPNRYDFSGTQLYFRNPVDNTTCILTIDLGTPPPTNTPRPNQTPSRTPTPDCRPESIRLRFREFQSYGRVRMDVRNNQNYVSRITGFTMQWQQLASPKIRLARVTAVASYGSVGSVLIWQASDPSKQDANPPTSGTEPSWVQNFSIPPGATVNLYLDFDGTSSNLGDLGMSPTVFNNSSIRVEGVCPGANIPIQTITPPPPSNTPRPTDTPAPYRSPTPRPPSSPTPNVPQPTVKPPNTPKPSNTPAPQVPPTRTPRPTDPGTGGTD